MLYFPLSLRQFGKFRTRLGGFVWSSNPEGCAMQRSGARKRGATVTRAEAGGGAPSSRSVAASASGGGVGDGGGLCHSKAGASVLFKDSRAWRSTHK